MKQVTIETWNALLSLFGLSKKHSELDEEVSFHLSERTSELIEQGTDPKTARQIALREFGGVEQYKEEAREMWGTRVIMDLIRDLKHSFRNLAKSKLFTLTATLALAIGIAASTTTFTILYRFVIDPFDFPDSDELVQIWSGDNKALSPADYLDLHAQCTTFSEFGVYYSQQFNIGQKDPASVSGIQCTDGALKAFGIAPLRGRFLEAPDEVTGADPVAVISYELWQSSFQGDPDIIGRSIRVNGWNRTVVGVMPRNFKFTGPWINSSDTEIWLPMNLEAVSDERHTHGKSGIARINKGTTIENANSELANMSQQLGELYPISNAEKKFFARTLHYEMTQYGAEKFWFLNGSAFLLLLVACINVASMLLARGAQRQGEYGMRVALGATRGHLARLVLAESLSLAIIGAIIGVPMAYYAIEFIAAGQPRVDSTSLDWSLLPYTVGITFGTAIIAGLPPFLATLRNTLATTIKSGTHGVSASKSRQGMLRAFVIAQVAIAVVLASSASLFSEHHIQMVAENENMNTDQVLSAKLNLLGRQYYMPEQQLQFRNQVLEAIAALPEVETVGMTNALPLEGGEQIEACVNDEEFEPGHSARTIVFTAITENYFATMGIALLQGRTLNPVDATREDGRFVVVVNETLAKNAWPDKDPIGKVIRFKSPIGIRHALVVGVVEDTRQLKARDPVKPGMYMPLESHYARTLYITVRSSGSLYALGPRIQEAVAKIDSEMPLEEIRTLKQVLSDNMFGTRLASGFFSVFMFLAIGLVAIGLSGTLSYQVSQRTKEIGIRKAIGALQSNIIRLLLRQSAKWVGLGLCIGLIGTYPLSKVLPLAFPRLGQLDIQSLAFSTGIVLLVAFATCYPLAYRASRADSLKALRDE